ncbi:unnamed protein product, partial [Protopolystoma xenopodis]
MGINAMVDIVMIADYFLQYRNLALTLATSGADFGTLVFPHLVTYLIDWVTWRFAMVGLSAIFTHQLVLAVSTHPLPPASLGAAHFVMPTTTDTGSPPSSANVVNGPGNSCSRLERLPAQLLKAMQTRQAQTRSLYLQHLQHQFGLGKRAGPSGCSTNRPVVIPFAGQTVSGARNSFRLGRHEIRGSPGDLSGLETGLGKLETVPCLNEMPSGCHALPASSTTFFTPNVVLEIAKVTISAPPGRQVRTSLISEQFPLRPGPKRSSSPFIHSTAEMTAHKEQTSGGLMLNERSLAVEGTGSSTALLT